MTVQAHRLGGRVALPIGFFVVLAGFGGVVTVVVVAALRLAAPGLDPDGDPPPGFLALYHAAALRFHLGPTGWSVLAAVGKIECDHGRSPLVGCHRGEENAAGARGPAQFLSATWARYGVDADGDGDRDVWDPADAIFGMANYLRASGAPRDWRRALFAYNHAGWYVEQVLEQAAAYRQAAAVAPVELPAVALGTDDWLVALPGAPGVRCDRRIVADVLTFSRAFGVRVTSCFGGAPRAIGGEHPLGLAIDVVPIDDNWSRTLALARAAGWSQACASSGCPGRGPFRVVLYNGFPGHGDPRHARTPHLHLSWQHAPAQPFTPAAWVRPITTSDGGGGNP